MAKPNVKVEIEFDTSVATDLAFTLDDPVRGLLDSTDYLLTGKVFLDVSQFVQEVQFERGKSRLLDRYEAGTMQVRLNNEQRIFDPKNPNSPYYGAIYPRLEVRISVGGEFLFVGAIMDWNIDYDPAGPSFATIVCSDHFTVLAQTILPNELPDVELSGARITRILNYPEVGWSADQRNIDTGTVQLIDYLIGENRNALEYLQVVEMTEQGDLFIARDGKLTFKQRGNDTVTGITFADDGTGIKYSGISVIFGTELLFNTIEGNVVGDIKYSVSDAASQALYGNSTFALNDTLHNNVADLEALLADLLAIYSQPEYRFNSLTFNLNELTPAEQETIFQLDFGDSVEVTFTPSKIPPAIVETASIIKISHEINQSVHTVTLSLGTL